MNKIDYVDVTEISGDDVSKEQVDRIYQRYLWAAKFCKGKDVIECGCGSGQGLGLLNKVSRSLIGSDYSDVLIQKTRDHYKDRIKIIKIDAQKIKFQDNSFDIVILFEAIYYLKNPNKFLSEAKRILRDGGKLLLVSANKSLYDFNPSPHTFRYYSILELKESLEKLGFKVNFFGGFPTVKTSIRQKLFRPIKKIAISMNLIPKTMAGKKILKRIVFGAMVKMPPEIKFNDLKIKMPVKISSNHNDVIHKVIYCSANITK